MERMELQILRTLPGCLCAESDMPYLGLKSEVKAENRCCVDCADTSANTAPRALTFPYLPSGAAPITRTWHWDCSVLLD